MDIWDKEKRSQVMSKIKGKNMKPEIALRKALFTKGFRYRINYSKLPGKPDIVLPKYHTAIFVNGCFWHYHKGCKHAHIPESNKEFWLEKLTNNTNRDNTNYQILTSTGWNVIVVWECQLKRKDNLTNIADEISRLIKSRASKPVAAHCVKLYEVRDDEVRCVAEKHHK